MPIWASVCIAGLIADACSVLERYLHSQRLVHLDASRLTCCMTIVIRTEVRML